MKTVKKTINYKKLQLKKYNKKDKNNITDNLILIKATKSYPTLKAILKR